MNFFSSLFGCVGAVLLLAACGTTDSVPAEPVTAGESRSVYPPPSDCVARPFVGVSANNLPEYVQTVGKVLDARFVNNPACLNNEVTRFQLGVYGQPSALSFLMKITSSDETSARVSVFPPTDLTYRLDGRSDYQVIDVPMMTDFVPPGAQVQISAMAVNLSGAPKKNSGGRSFTPVSPGSGH